LCAAINGCLFNNRNIIKKKDEKLVALFINERQSIGRAFILYFTNRTFMPLNVTSMSGMCQKTRALRGFIKIYDNGSTKALIKKIT